MWFLRLVPDDDSSPTQQQAGPALRAEYDEGATCRILVMEETAIHLKGVKATRNRLMKMDQVMGLSLRELADKYRISVPEVRKGLSDAQRAGVLEVIEAGVFQDIMPKALAVLENHLDRGENLKAVELALALFGAVKAKTQPAKGAIEISMPGGDNRAVGIVALDEIRQERIINAQKRERHDVGAAVHHQGGEDAPRTLPGLGREREPEGEDRPGGGSEGVGGGEDAL